MTLDEMVSQTDRRTTMLSLELLLRLKKTKKSWFLLNQTLIERLWIGIGIQQICFLQVLKTIPWEKVDIEVLTVEVTHAGEIAEGSEKDIRDYLEEQGYIYFHTLGHDEVYIREDLYHGKYNPDLEKLEQFYKDIQHTCRVYSRQENFLNLFNDERRDEGIGPQCIKPIIVNDT